jgi:hypothetical protein
MIFRFIKANQLGKIILLIVTIATAAKLFFKVPKVVVETYSFFPYFSEWGWQDGGWLGKVLAFCIVLLIFYSLWKINDTHKLLQINSAAMVWCCLTTLLFFPLVLTNLIFLLANLLLAIVLHQLLFLYQAKQGKGALFLFGLLISATSLLVLPFSFYLLLLLMVFILLRPFDLRELLLGSLGFILPLYWVGSLFFLRHGEVIINDYAWNQQLGELKGLFNTRFIVLSLLGIVLAGRVLTSSKMIVRIKSQLQMLNSAVLISLLIMGFLMDWSVISVMLGVVAIYFASLYESMNKAWMLDALLIPLWIIGMIL